MKSDRKAVKWLKKVRKGKKIPGLGLLPIELLILIVLVVGGGLGDFYGHKALSDNRTAVKSVSKTSATQKTSNPALCVTGSTGCSPQQSSQNPATTPAPSTSSTTPVATPKASSATPSPSATTQPPTPAPNCSEIVQNLENGYENQSMTSYNQQIINEEVYVNTTQSNVYNETGIISVAAPQLAIMDVDGTVWSVNDELSIQYDDLSNQANIYGCPNAVITVSPIVIPDPTIAQIIADTP